MDNSELDQFRELLREGDEGQEQAPASLKSRLYSALIREQQESGPLASLESSVQAGYSVCVFEKLVQIAPLGEKAKSPFFCGVCHARILGEHLEKAPIFWQGCPYVMFRKS